MKKSGSVILLGMALLAFCPAPGQEWKVLADSAAFFAAQRNSAKALEYYLIAAELLKKDSAQTISYYRLNNDIGDLQVAIGQYAKAEPFYVSAIEVIEKLKGRENAFYAQSCNNLGWLYRLLGRYDKAEPLLIAARDTRARVLGKENADYATSCNRLAVVYLDAGQYDLARPLYMEALQIRERVLGKEHVDYAMSCNNLAILYVVTGKPAEAEPLYLEAKRIREKVLGKEHPFYAASCNNLAALYLDMGLYKKAEPLYLEAKGIRERTLGKEHPDYASSCDNLAILYMDTGNYETAEALYKEARQIREKSLGLRHIEYAKGCNNLALLYKLLGQYERSAALFSEAKSIFEETVGKDHFEYGKCCNNLGAVYMDMGEYGRATPLYEEARQVWAKVLGTAHPEYAKGCHNLALMQMKNGNYDAAEALFMEANDIRAKTLGKEHPDYAEGCDNLSTLYLEKGEYEKAIALLLQAKQIREKILGASHPDYLQTCINLANAYRRGGNREMAGNLFTEAFSSQQALLEKIFRFTTEPEKQAYLAKVNEYRNYFLSFSLSDPDEKVSVYAYEVSLATKNLIVSAAQHLRQVISATNDTALLNTYIDWMNIREQLAFWYVKPVAERRVQVTELEEKANRLEKELIRSSEPFRLEQQQLSWREIQQSLQAGEAAIEFSTFNYYSGQRSADSIFYIAVILRKDRPAPELVKLFEKKQLDAILHNRTTNPGMARLNALYKATGNPNASLYNLLWQPLESKLQGIQTVYFSPAGELYKVAFAALPVNSKKVLGDQYRLVQLNTTASVSDKTEPVIATADRLLLYGGVQYEADSMSIRRAVLQYGGNDLAKWSVPEELLRSSVGDFYYLSESEKEVKEISRLARQQQFDVTVVNSIHATEESIKDLSGKPSPAVLHIATHGYFFPDPQTGSKEVRTTGRSLFRQSGNPLIRSGLAMAGANNAWRGKPVSGVEDGILTAYEVSNMFLPDTKLAVLSACETGLGDIQGSEGVYGLQRSFRLAGVRYLVMSLWKVPDSEAAEFMQAFYKNLFAKQTIQDAFAGAQQELRNKYRNDPYKWAAWVLVR